MSAKAQEVQNLIELQEYNKKCLKGSQVYRGGSDKGEWYHVIFNNQDEAQACAKQIHADGVSMAIPKVYPKDPVHHARYPEGTYFFRVHQSAFEKFKATYKISQEVAVYGQDKPAVKAAAAEEQNKTCVIS